MRNCLKMKKLAKTLCALLCLVACLDACGSKDNPSEQGGEGGNKPVSLEAPAGLTLKSAGKTQLVVQWQPVTGAKGYAWTLEAPGHSLDGKTSQRNVTISELKPGTSYSFKVQAVADGGVTSAWSQPLVCETLPDGSGGGGGETPDAKSVCVDQPLVVDIGKTPVLGTSGLIQVFKSDGTLVDKIDMADMAKVTVLEDGTMIPKETMNQETTVHSFMDLLHSTRWRPVHYTPLRIKGNTLEIKLHNEALSFGGSYYLTMDASVAGKAVGKEDMPFVVKGKPSGNTLHVAADGSADFCTVQGALSYATSLGKDTAVTIEIAAGTYNELLYLRDKNNLTIKGAGRDKTVIAYPNNESYATGSGAAVQSKPALGAKAGAMGGRCLFLAESADKLVLEDLTIENTFWADDHKGQAETIYFNADNKRLTIENCSLISWQDTFLCKGEVWVHNSLIAGHCDYIWGQPKACLFENCEIRSRAGGYIVQARVQSAASKGFVFLNCKLTAEEGVAEGSMYLARSAGQADCYDNVTFVNCTMHPVIAAAGWHTTKTPNPASGNATSGWKEYASVKPDGSSASGGRNGLGYILSEAEAQAYGSKAAVLGW